MSDSVFHFVSKDLWEKHSSGGVYAPPELKFDGFLHLCLSSQIWKVYSKYYAECNSICVLELDPKILGTCLRLEPPFRPGLTEGQREELRQRAQKGETFELYPHLYGPLDHRAVLKTHCLSTYLGLAWPRM